MRWEKELKENISTIEQLEEYFPLTRYEKQQLRRVIRAHPMNISRYYFSLIDKNNPCDPIKKMVVPSIEELVLEGCYDTSGELDNTMMPGLQHKYPQTVLILATNMCSTYCRYCFRKRLVGLPNKEILSRLMNAIAYIKEHKEVTNVLISGGDPFILPTETTEKFLYHLSRIPHVRFVRFGSRIPVTFPDRLLEENDGLLDILKQYSSQDKRIYVVTQFNHPNEITEQSTAAIDRLISANVIVSNQAVLLAGVNDDPYVLAKLHDELSCIGVNPYYVFQCRPVKRVKHHFQLPLYKGYDIVEKAKGMLNGHAKRFKYVMSHKTGKIEIVGIMNNEIYFKYHQAKNLNDIGKFFKRELNKTAGWLDELKEYTSDDGYTSEDLLLEVG
jgi:KamA family protein